MRIDTNHPPSDIPYEDHHFTKEIIRMEMHILSNAIKAKSSLSELHHIIKDTKGHMKKLEDPELMEALDQMKSLIDHNYPLSEHTSWDALQMLGKCFEFIDQKTLY